MRILISAVGPPKTGPTGVLLPAAYPWPAEQPWTRVAMLRSLDGGVAGPDGRSRSISSATDRAVLAEIRRLSDAIVVGANTVRLEAYGPIGSSPETGEERRALGLADAPVLAVVSASLDLPWHEQLFTGSTVRPIVVTGQRAAEDALDEAREHAEVVVLPGDHPRAADIVGALHAMGLRRLVCEGGPSLLASFTAEDLVDEVDLTISPTSPTLPTPTSAAAPGGPQVESHQFELRGLLEHESFLFARYLRADRGDDRP